jgi:hypothetical protein
MRTGLPLTACIALLAVAAGVGAELRAREELREADWLLARAQAHADSYVQSFVGEHITAQLATFKERRVTLARAEKWEQVRNLAVVALALLTLLAYWQYLMAQLEALRLDVPSAASARAEASLPEAQPATGG